MTADSTTANANRARMEFTLVEDIGGGKSKTSRFDCATTREYFNWLRALNFAGFVKGDEGDATREAYRHMDEYIFQIRVETGAPQPDLDWISIVSEAITLFRSSKGDRRIIYVARKHNCEVLTILKNRIIRIRRNVGTLDEDRIELLCPTITAFDLLQEKLNAEGYLGARTITPTGLGGLETSKPAEGVRATRYASHAAVHSHHWTSPDFSEPNLVAFLSGRTRSKLCPRRRRMLLYRVQSATAMLIKMTTRYCSGPE